MNKPKETSKLDSEIRKFEAIADDWWNPKGSFKPLHKLTPLRMEYILKNIKENFLEKKNSEVKILDIGCGGGIISECLSRLAFNVEAIDASEVNIKIAKAHAEKQDLKIDYSCQLAENIKDKKYDLVIALEIVEHVDNLSFFIDTCCNLVGENGLIIFSTMNKTFKSYLESIIAAEYILKWLPQSTHDWNKFVRPSDLVLKCENNGFELLSLQGLEFKLSSSKFIFTNNLENNYLVCLKKKTT